jgi:DNA polymerase
MEKLIKAIENCRLCNERIESTTPIPGEGNINGRVLFIGELPPEYAHYSRSMFSGPTGKVLKELINLSSLDFEDIYVTSLLKCTLPLHKERVHFNLSNCFPFLASQIRKIDPIIICPLGSTVLSVLTGGRLNMEEHRGKPVKFERKIYFPLIHPSKAFYDFNKRHQMERDIVELGNFYNSLIKKR